MKPGFKTIIKIGVTVIGLGAIVSLFWHKFDDVVTIITEANGILVAAGVGLYVGANIFCAARFQSVLRMQQIRLPILKVWRLNYIGYFFNLFMPSSIGGDIGKAYYIYKLSDKKIPSFISVFIDRIIGLFSVCLLCCISVLIIYKKIDNAVIPLVITVFSLSVITGIIFFTNDSCARFLKSLHIPFIPHAFAAGAKKAYILIHECKNHKRLAVRALFFSVLFQLCSITAIYILGQALAIELSLITYFSLVPLIYVFSMLPSINGLGVREGSMIYFFSFFISSEQAIALSILFDMGVFSCSFVGLFCYIFYKHISYKQLNQEHFTADEITIEKGGSSA